MSITLFFENRALYGVMWKNMIEPDRPQKTTWRLCILCWVPKATDRHSEYVIRIAFTLQHWLHEHTSLLPFTYIACIFRVMTYLVFNRDVLHK